MNERIRELAHQADLVIKKSNGNDFRFGAMDPKLEKFAELIVQECVDTVSDCSIEYCTRPQIVNEIKEHFGVGE